MQPGTTELQRVGPDSSHISAVCGPMFTRFSRHVEEASQFIMLSTSHSIAKILVKSYERRFLFSFFVPPIFNGEGHPNFCIGVH